MSLRFKRHHPLIVLLALVAIVLVLGLGDQPIIPYTVPDNVLAVEHDRYIAHVEISSLLHTLGIQ